MIYKLNIYLFIVSTSIPSHVDSLNRQFIGHGIFLVSVKYSVRYCLGHLDINLIPIDNIQTNIVQHLVILVIAIVHSYFNCIKS